ncbi:MAG: molybdopterin-binding protein [Clostridia bacterium]|nr:molybdopterin-binding protein [Clostridia bacterium]
MLKIKTEDAIGQVLGHDMTQIIPGVIKDARFRKGHILAAEDIPVLLSMGKEHIYVYEKKEGVLHEDEGAQILWSMLRNQHIRPSEVKEGKIECFAATDGLFKVDRDRLRLVNSAGEMIIATRHGDTPVKAGDKLAGTRIIPLVIEEEKLRRVQEAVGDKPLLELRPYQICSCGLIVTGNEVSNGRIEDKFTPVIKKKLAAYGVEIIEHRLLGDCDRQITAAIGDMAAKGVEMVVCTGGMSVDPDDRTPLAIRNSGAAIVSYGAPVLPGAMFLLSYLGSIPVLGLPGCVMYAKSTIFDILLPRILSRDMITAAELAGLGEGGLCLGCAECTYPNCGFGKGR